MYILGINGKSRALALYLLLNSMAQSTKCLIFHKLIYDEAGGWWRVYYMSCGKIVWQIFGMHNVDSRGCEMFWVGYTKMQIEYMYIALMVMLLLMSHGMVKCTTNWNFQEVVSGCGTLNTNIDLIKCVDDNHKLTDGNETVSHSIAPI